MFSWLTNVHLGAWWAAICSLLAGICGTLAINRYFVIAGFGFSAFGILLGIVGSVVEGISAAVFSRETGCVNTDSRVGYGSTDGKVDASICAGFHGNYQSNCHERELHDMEPQHYNINYNIPYDNNNNFLYNHPNFFYYYFNEPHYHYTNESYYANHYYFNNYQYSSTNNNYYYNHPYYFNYYHHNQPPDDDNTTSSSNQDDGTSPVDNNNNNQMQYYASSFGQNHQCICSDTNYCYGYTLTSGDNCGTILSVYSPLLVSSTVLCVIITILCFVYCILTCIAGCGSTEKDSYNAASAAEYADENYAVELGSQKPASLVAANLTSLSQITIQQQQRYSFHLPAAPGLYGMAPSDSRAVVGMYPHDDPTKC